MGLIKVDWNLLRLIRIGFEFAGLWFWFWFMEMWIRVQYHLVFFLFFKKKIDKLLLFYLDTDMPFFIIILVLMSTSSVPTKYTVCHVGSFH